MSIKKMQRKGTGPTSRQVMESREAGWQEYWRNARWQCLQFAIQSFGADRENLLRHYEWLRLKA